MSEINWEQEATKFFGAEKDILDSPKDNDLTKVPLAEKIIGDFLDKVVQDYCDGTPPVEILDRVRKFMIQSNYIEPSNGNTGQALNQNGQILNQNGQVPEGKKARFIDTQDLLMKAPEQEGAQWILEGFIVKDGITLLAGEAGSFKTTIAFLMANAISKGKSFLNLPTQKTKVLYVDMESGERFITSRLKKILPIDGERGVFYVLPKENQDFRSVFDQNFETLIEEFKDGVVIIDSFRRAFGGDENDSSTVNKVMGKLRELALKYGVSFVLLHHRGKSAENSYRGSSDILASVDVAYSLTRGRGDEKRVLKLEGLKNRFEEEQTFIWEITEDQTTISIRDLKEEMERQKRFEEQEQVETIRQIILSFENQGQKPNQSQVIKGAMGQGLGKEKVKALLKKWEGKCWNTTKGDKNQTLYSVSQLANIYNNTTNWQTNKLTSENNSSEQGNSANFWQVGKLRNDKDLQLANSCKLNNNKDSQHVPPREEEDPPLPSEPVNGKEHPIVSETTTNTTPNEKEPPLDTGGKEEADDNKPLESFRKFKEIVPESLWEKTDEQERYFWFEEFREFPIRIVREAFRRNEDWFELAYHYCKWAWKVEQEKTQ